MSLIGACDSVEGERETVMGLRRAGAGIDLQLVMTPADMEPEERLVRLRAVALFLGRYL
jgi:hypothetical protein